MNSNRPMTKRTLTLVIVLLAVALVIAVATPTVAYYIRSTEQVGDSHSPARPSAPGFADPPVITQRISFLSNEEDPLENLYIEIPYQGYPVYVRVAVVVTWLKPADCTCAETACGEAEDDDCICDDCATECLPDCEKCNNDLSDSCENCANCAGKMCLECADCPHCNDDEDDDWDVIHPYPTEGKDKDYYLEIGNTWEKRDSSGIYYHKTPVECNSSETPLGTKITVDTDDEHPEKNTPFLAKFERLATAQLPISVDGLDVKDCVMKVEIIVQTLQAIGSTDQSDDAAWKDAWGEGATGWPDRGH